MFFVYVFTFFRSNNRNYESIFSSHHLRPSLTARINFSFRFSALSLLRDIAAQIAAGSQPKTVICKIKQITAVMIFPRKKKDKKGNIMANNIGLFLL